jgi:hypothetical protein
VLSGVCDDKEDGVEEELEGVVGGGDRVKQWKERRWRWEEVGKYILVQHWVRIAHTELLGKT